MTWWHRLHADLARPETTIDRREVPFLVAGAAAIVAAAQTTDPGTAVEVLLVVAAGVGLVFCAVAYWLPRAMIALLVTALVAAAMWRDGNLEVALFLSVLATLSVAWHLGSLTKALVAMGAAASAPLLVSIEIPEEEIGWTPWAAANVVMFVLGRSLRRHRMLIDQLEEAREALAEQAVADERQRIARELHDLAGHTLAAVVLHVTGARHVLRRDVDEAERALVRAETVGRVSLDQIRSAVASLRTHERGTDPALPGSADLIELVQEYRRAGLEVTAQVEPQAADIEGPVGTAVHRITREALANVARHASGNRVELVLEVDALKGEVRLVVADHGRTPDTDHHDEGHFGLVGMRERARALGGELDAGPTADGWRVEARLPRAPAGQQEFLP